MRMGNSEKGEKRVPRLAPDCDPTVLSLSPNEGYLLSRIDGHTCWRDLRQIGGLPPGEVDRCLERWLKDGLIAIDGADGAKPGADTDGAGGKASQRDAQKSSAQKSSAKKTSASKTEGPKKEAKANPHQIEARHAVDDAPVNATVDASLDLEVDFQKQVLAFVSDLNRPYHEILGVAKDADGRALKKAYFQLSKRYHPDRYFRRNTGAFGDLLERCFKRILEAYELLSDPATRAEVQKETPPEAGSVAAEASEAASETSAADAAASQADKAKKRMSAIEARKRLRARVGKLGAHHQILGQRKRKAKGFFEAGMTSFREERWLEAAGSVRLAIAFDPKNQAYREEFVKVQRKAHEERATLLVRQAEAALELRDYRDALGYFEEAVHYRPFDADLAYRTAKIAFQTTDDLRKAKELAASACEIEPEVGMYHRLLGQVFKAAGLGANAKRELQLAVKLDPKDKEAKSELKSL